jgi:two-component system LytT family response regulator
MTQLVPGLSTRSAAPGPTWRWTAAAFGYWLLFMGVLEPGNLLDALDHGVRLDLGREAVRLVGAGLLGAALTPLLLGLAARFPIRGARKWRNAGVQAVCTLCLAPGLVVLSCVLAAWLFAGKAWPSLDQIRAELLANALLVMFCLAGFQAAIHLWRARTTAGIAPSGAETAPAWISRITIKVRGRMEVLELASVDWIETQGNYQALHVGDQVHLIRKTSAELAAELDPSRFVRAHRQAIVAIDRVSGLEPMPNGDATLRLTTGENLRLSRRHRKALIARL